MLRWNAKVLALGVMAAVGAIGLSPTAVAQDAADLTQPEGWALPEGDHADLIARGEKLYADASIGTTGNACATCHMDFGNYNQTFLEPYPHFVAMGKNMFDMDEVTAAEMVQLCMVVPMGTDTLPWDSQELAALTAYVFDEQERFVESR